MSKYFIGIIMVLSVGSAAAHEDIPVPNLGDTLNRTITLYDEERIGRNI